MKVIRFTKKYKEEVAVNQTMQLPDSMAKFWIDGGYALDTANDDKGKQPEGGTDTDGIGEKPFKGKNKQ